MIHYALALPKSFAPLAPTAFSIVRYANKFATLPNKKAPGFAEGFVTLSEQFTEHFMGDLMRLCNVSD